MEELRGDSPGNPIKKRGEGPEGILCDLGIGDGVDAKRTLSAGPQGQSRALLLGTSTPVRQPTGCYRGERDIRGFIEVFAR